MFNNKWINWGLGALSGIVFYVTQVILFYLGVSFLLSALISAVVSPLLVEIVIRMLAITWLPQARWFRRLNFHESILEGLWLERLNRDGKEHYSLFRFVYDPKGALANFAMVGASYDAEEFFKHSDWESSLLKATPTVGGFDVEYTYQATRSDGDGLPKVGYGMSRFNRCFDAMGNIENGSGFYHAAEEPQIYLCRYWLYRVDEKFKKLVGANQESLCSHAAIEDFLRKVAEHFKPSTPHFLNATSGEPERRTFCEEFQRSLNAKPSGT
ncbi:hypothetical protein LOC68_27045 [Blastopirellula sp. JC732]|uniref:Uncharacterized protein n=1 Tax=Blastopirellula sediminis TaxID=2894196 RepID=A0A9X1SJ77_9BACT|nr:hypothetical protein [Blastopirellula sediminis]MCC9604634.1 hypothetical protein [Blastopirellula sediminis]MCC9632067.1 hypothetical protein [Blastopirellula sediminis]